MSIEIEKIIRENKPEITESTIKAYMLNLQKLHDRLHGTKEFSDIKWLKQSDDVRWFLAIILETAFCREISAKSR